MSSGNGNPGSIGGRFLIVIYGLAMVALGSYPIQQEYGSVLNFLAIKVKTVSKMMPLDELRKLKSDLPKREGDDLSEPLIPLESLVSRAKLGKAGHSKTSPKVEQKDFDQLTSNDKKQLDDLLKQAE